MSEQTVPLGTVAYINPTVGPLELEADEFVDFVPMAAVEANQTLSASDESRPYGEVKKGYTSFIDGDILLAKITPCFENGKISQIRVNSEVGFGSTEFHVVRPRADLLDGRYLVHLLRQKKIRTEGERRMTGSAGQRRVPKSFLESLPIFLPPISEQRRIATILDKADALRAKRREALAQLDRLAQSIFMEMFGDPLTNSEGWPEGTSLGEVADIVSGVTKGRKLEGKTTREVPYLAVANVQEMRLNLSTVKRIDATEEEIERYALRDGDLLLTEGGDPDKLGRGTLWHGELPECIHQNHVFRVRVTADSITPYFLNWLVGSQRGKRYFLKSAKQTTGIASINMTQLRGFPLLLPPVSLQREFEEAICAVKRQTARLRAAAESCNALFATLQNRAFKGEL